MNWGNKREHQNPRQRKIQFIRLAVKKDHLYQRAALGKSDAKVFRKEECNIIPGLTFPLGEKGPAAIIKYLLTAFAEKQELFRAVEREKVKSRKEAARMSLDLRVTGGEEKEKRRRGGWKVKGGHRKVGNWGDTTRKNIQLSRNCLVRKALNSGSRETIWWPPNQPCSAGKGGKGCLKNIGKSKEDRVWGGEGKWLRLGLGRPTFVKCSSRNRQKKKRISFVTDGDAGRTFTKLKGGGRKVVSFQRTKRRKGMPRISNRNLSRNDCLENTTGQTVRLGKREELTLQSTPEKGARGARRKV